MTNDMNSQNEPIVSDQQMTISEDIDQVDDNNTYHSPTPTITRGAATSSSDQLKYKGGPIPDYIRKSYVQQKLPVRKQSLAAFGPTPPNRRPKVPARHLADSIIHQASDNPTHALTTGATSSSIPSKWSPNSFNTPLRNATTASSLSTPLSPSSPSSPSPTCSNTDSHSAVYTTMYGMDAQNSLLAARASSSTSSLVRGSLYHSPEQSNGLSTGTTECVSEDINSKDDKDDDDFNFGDRPPSTINCTRPILSAKSSSSSSVSLYAIPTLKLLDTQNLDANNSTSNVSLEQNGINVLETASPINIHLHDLTKYDEDDDDSTVFSPSTPAIYDDSDDNANNYNNWPIPTPSLSETINTEERERPYWRKGSVGDIIQSVSSSLPRTSQSSPIITGEQTGRRQLRQQGTGTRADGQLDPIDTLSDQQKQQIEQQKLIQQYYSPSSLSPQTNFSTLSLQRKTSQTLSMLSARFYPALLSQMAQELYRRLPVQTLVKDDIEYPHAFSGKEAVECLIQILHINDRNLGLLVGRALDHQQFFHDVTYEHHLRDSTEKIYQFKQPLVFLLGQAPITTRVQNGDSLTEKETNQTEIDEKELPNGVFTLLTNCYSPTCSRGQGCYSIHCPRKEKLVQRSSSQTSLQEKEEERSLWIHSVPKAVLDSTSKEEMKRQECIYELIYTEADFVKDLQYVHNFWVKPLITQDIIPDERREHFVQEVFWNMADIEKVNHVLSQSLTALQKEQHVVHSIGNLLLNHVSRFDPFVAYGAHQIVGKFKFELEKKRNPVFATFVQNTERLPESRRLELNGYLTKPTTRLGKYNLLLREILKRTPKDNPDYELLPKVMDSITNYLVQVNTEAGKCENIFNLQQIEERLSFKTSADHVELALRDTQRQIIFQGRLNRKGNSTSETSDLQVFLFDHYLVFAKIKQFNHLEYYKVYRKPIPLVLLTVTAAANNLKAKRASTLLSYSRSSVSNLNSYSSLPRASTSENLLTSKSSASTSITFYHHGKKGLPPITLYASTVTSRKTWMEKITQQQDLLSRRRAVFSVQYIVERQFLTSNRVHDTLLIDNTTKGSATNRDTQTINREDTDDDDIGRYTMVVGTDMGVYVRTRNDDNGQWDYQETAMKRVISLDRVSQIELMENSQLLVLADKTLWTFPLDDILDASDKPILLKKGKTVSTNTSFFHIGECMNKKMVCIAKPNTLSATTIRVLEPIATDESKKTKTGFSIRRLVRNGPVGLRPYKDLYLPSGASSISLLKSKMCITCPREIGVVDMRTFGVQALLDPGDDGLSFVFSRQDLRPIALYRVQFAEYLICYNEFGFFVDQRGRWIRSSHIMEWEGEPDAFALSYPYILAFEPGFIEVRNILTGEVDQLIRGKNIRCTNDRQGKIQGTMNDPDNNGYQVIFQLNLLKSHG